MQNKWGVNRNFRNVNKLCCRVVSIEKRKEGCVITESIFFTLFRPYSPFACVTLNDYKQTHCTTDSLLIVHPPVKCGAIWQMDKWGRLMVNKEHHSFSPTRSGQKANIFNQIYMFLRNIGC